MIPDSVRDKGYVYYEEPGIVLLKGDCLEILPLFEPDSIDLVLTDPPYSKNTHKQAKTNKGIGHGNKLITFNCINKIIFNEIIEHCIRISITWSILTCDYLHAATQLEKEYFVRLGVWVKNNPMPQISADRPGQGHETLLFLHSLRTKKAWNGGGKSAVYTTNVNTNSQWPTQKPLELYMKILKDFPCNIILDPFFGSGTTAVAAKQLKKKYIGIERETEALDIAIERLRQGVLI